MKLGGTMEGLKPVTVMEMGSQETTKKADNTKIVKLSLIGVFALMVIGGIILGAVYIGGHVSTTTLKESSYLVKTSDGEEVKETIMVTDTEEVVGLKDGTKVVYDYSKGFMTMKVTTDDDTNCYVSSFDRTSLNAPSEDEVEEEMTKADNVTAPKVTYEVDTSRNVDPSILSKTAQHMCRNVDIYWMTKSTKDQDQMQKRSCFLFSRYICDCCPVRCSRVYYYYCY